MRWENRRQSGNVEDRRGQGFRPGKSTGILGIIVLLVGMYYGVDLSGLVGTPQLGGQPQTSALEATQEEHLNQLSRVVLAETEDTWGQYFARQGQRYAQQPTLVLYTGATQSRCGTGQAAMGPFYCPNDQKIYLDLSFYEDMKTRLGAQGGDAAFAYVIAHEVGHHVQNLIGVLPQVHRAQQSSNQTRANQLSVRLELQADCFAGVWARNAQQNQLFEAGDIERAFNAAEAVGDDRIQKRSQGYAVPDSFTHGSSEQRKTWFQRGLNSGNPTQCNTFG